MPGFHSSGDGDYCCVRAVFEYERHDEIMFFASYKRNEAMIEPSHVPYLLP